MCLLLLVIVDNIRVCYYCCCYMAVVILLLLFHSILYCFYADVYIIASCLLDDGISSTGMISILAVYIRSGNLIPPREMDSFVFRTLRYFHLRLFFFFFHIATQLSRSYIPLVFFFFSSKGWLLIIIFLAIKDVSIPNRFLLIITEAANNNNMNNIDWKNTKQSRLNCARDILAQTE